MPLLLELFLTFLKIGAVSFGGGYAMIPVISDEVISRGWMTQSEVMNFIAVAESTPGPVAINMATFIGATKGGILGALLSTLGVVLPSFVIILIVASILKGLIRYAGVQGVLKGIRPVIVCLITVTGIFMLLNCVLAVERIGDSVQFDWKSLVVFAIITTTHLTYKKITKKAPSAILLILISAVLGILFFGVI